MYIFDQRIEIQSQFEIPKKITFKTSESKNMSEQTFIMNKKQEPQQIPKGFFMGSTFHKMNVNLNFNNMQMKNDTSQSNEFNQTKNSILTINDSQLQKSNIRTSYILEKYEISK